MARHHAGDLLRRGVIFQDARGGDTDAAGQFLRRNLAPGDFVDVLLKRYDVGRQAVDQRAVQVEQDGFQGGFRVQRVLIHQAIAQGGQTAASISKMHPIFADAAQKWM